MCGIAGIVGGGQRDVEASLRRMRSAIAHRGPDDAGCQTWLGPDGGRAALAHSRLAIIEPGAAGHQPMSTDDGRYTITFNGEIYNRPELRRELAGRGVCFRTRTDTEVLLRLWAEEGPNCLPLLNGMYAFAIRDNLSGTVYVARDRMGVKPLYYFAGGGCFIFASEVRALLASGRIPRVLDEVSLASYLSFGAVQEPRTIVRDVRSLPPAHYAEVEATGRVRKVAAYWRLPQEKFKGDRREAAAETRRLLEESVKSQLVADVPVGAFLSGGIDSSAIVALMSRQSAKSVRAVTVSFNENEFSEHHFARLVVDKWRVAHQEVILSEAELLSSLTDAVSAIDQPTIDGINTWIVSRATKQAGITVALSGLGGDELFGGYPSFRRVPRSLRYAPLLGRLGGDVSERVSSLVVRALGNTLALQKAAAAVSAGGDALASYASVRGLFSRDARGALLGESSGDGRPGGHYFIPRETVDLLDATRENGDIFNRVTRYELTLYMANMLLRDTDAMSMAHPLEVRVPFLDHRLVEWVYALPGSLKSGSPNKSLLVEALGQDLPREVSRRRKMGFTLPFEKWLPGELRPYVRETLGKPGHVERAGLRARAVEDLLGQFYEGRKTVSWSRIWSLVVLVDWCVRHDMGCAS